MGCCNKLFITSPNTTKIQHQEKYLVLFLSWCINGRQGVLKPNLCLFLCQPKVLSYVGLNTWNFLWLCIDQKRGIWRTARRRKRDHVCKMPWLLWSLCVRKQQDVFCCFTKIFLNFVISVAVGSTNGTWAHAYQNFEIVFANGLYSRMFEIV